MENTNYEKGRNLLVEVDAEANALTYDPSFRAGEDCVRVVVDDLAKKAKEAARLMGVDPPREVPWLLTVREILNWNPFRKPPQQAAGGELPSLQERQNLNETK